MAVIGYLIYGTVSGMYSAYGSMGLNYALIDFMKQNDGRWPKSWEELQPHYKDMFLRTHTVYFIRRYCDLSWDIDPHQLLKLQLHEPHSSEIWNGKDSACPVIFMPRRETLPMNDRHWILTDELYHYLSETEKAKKART